MKKLIIIGAGGHGKVVADVAIKNGYEDIVFLDDDEKIKECAGFPVVGNTMKAINMDGDKIVAVGDARTREHLMKNINGLVTLIHPDAVISRRVEIGEGSVIMAGVIINSDSKIGKGCIINTCSSLDHDCIIHDFAHISVGAHLAGMVDVGKYTWVGAGAIVINNLNICDKCMIGAGAVVVKNISLPGTYIGVPARRLAE